MSLDPVLARHYINVPKPQSASRPIPSSLTSNTGPSLTPKRSQTLAHPASTYSLSDLISLSPSPLPASPSLGLHPPPVPATASKIDTVNRILRRDSHEFLEGLVKQGKLDAGSPELGLFSDVVKDKERERERSRTMPIPVPPPVKIRSNTLSQIGNGFGQLIEQDQEEQDEDDKGKVNQNLVLDFEMSTLSPIDIELMSARKLPPSVPVPLTPRHPPAGAGASSIFDRSLGSAGGGSYSPASPSPLSLSIAQSLSKRHDGLRSAHFGTGLGITSSPISKSPAHGQVPVSAARSPSIRNVTIVSSPIEDLPWRKNSILTPNSNTNSRGKETVSKKIIPGKSLNAFAAPFPLPRTTPNLTHIDPPVPVPAARAESSTLPLPASLPRKPTSILPPVFVKRESAMLPQTMALPDVPPMGDAWVGENSLSGNEKRRRASEMLAPTPAPAPGSLSWTSGNGGAEGSTGSAGSVPGSRRPQRLVSLGERLKQNISRPVV